MSSTIKCALSGPESVCCPIGGPDMSHVRAHAYLRSIGTEIHVSLPVYSTVTWPIRKLTFYANHCRKKRFNQREHSGHRKAILRISNFSRAHEWFPWNLVIRYRTKQNHLYLFQVPEEALKKVISPRQPRLWKPLKIPHFTDSFPSGFPRQIGRLANS